MASDIFVMWNKASRQWMEDHEYESVHQMQGSMSQLRCADPGAFERAQYMRAVKGLQHVQV
jgi:dihydroorotate dehydrogenase (fumarate)